MKLKLYHIAQILVIGLVIVLISLMIDSNPLIRIFGVVMILGGVIRLMYIPTPPRSQIKKAAKKYADNQCPEESRTIRKAFSAGVEWHRENVLGTNPLTQQHSNEK